MKKPRWRSLIVPTVILVLTAGLLSGGLPAAGAGPPAAPRSGGGGSGILSIAGISFASADSRNAYSYMGWGGLGAVAPDGSSPWPFFSASAELPDGATINSLTLFYSDSDFGVGRDVILRLHRCDGLGGVDDMAAVSSSANNGIGSASSTSIFQPLVDNEHYAYLLTAEFESSIVTLYGAHIVFSPNFSAAGQPAEALPSDEQAGAPSETDPVVAAMRGEQAVVQSGGEIIPLAVPPPRAGAARDADIAAGASPAPSGVQPQGGGSAAWRRYTVAGGRLPCYVVGHPALLELGWSPLRHERDSHPGRPAEPHPRSDDPALPLHLLQQLHCISPGWPLSSG